MTAAKEDHWFEYRSVGDVLVVTLTHAEWFDEQACDFVGRQLLARIDDGAHRMVLDCSGVERMSSDMLGEIISLHKRLLGVNGRLVLCSIRPKLREVFDVLCLDRLFQIVKDESEALAALTGGSSVRSSEH